MKSIILPIDSFTKIVIISSLHGNHPLFISSNCSFVECVRKYQSLLHRYNNELVACTETTFSDENKCQLTTKGLSFSTGVRIFRNVDFKICSSDDHGGAIKCTREGTELRVIGCTFADCTVNNPDADQGGGVYAKSLKSVLTQSCFFNSCSGFWGGGLYINLIHSTPSFSDCVFNSCKGGYLGGGAFVGQCTKTSSFVACSDCVFIKGCDISAAYDLRGGGLYLDIYSNNHANTVSNVLFTKNSVNYQGGGLRIYESELGLSYSVHFCFFSGNTASNCGQDVHLVSVTFNAFLFCFTTSTAQDRLYVHPTVEEKTTQTETHIPDWHPHMPNRMLTVKTKLELFHH